MELNREQIAGILDIIFNKPDIMGMYVITSSQALLLIKIINELTEENERLRNRITCQVVFPNEKLEEIKNECLEKIEFDIKAIQADTVRKFIERLKEFYVVDTDDGLYAVLDQIADEMFGEVTTNGD